MVLIIRARVPGVSMPPGRKSESSPVTPMAGLSAQTRIFLGASSTAAHRATSRDQVDRRGAVHERCAADHLRRRVVHHDGPEARRYFARAERASSASHDGGRTGAGRSDELEPDGLQRARTRRRARSRGAGQISQCGMDACLPARRGRRMLKPSAIGHRKERPGKDAGSSGRKSECRCTARVPSRPSSFS